MAIDDQGWETLEEAPSLPQASTTSMDDEGWETQIVPEAQPEIPTDYKEQTPEQFMGVQPSGLTRSQEMEMHVDQSFGSAGFSDPFEVSPAGYTKFKASKRAEAFEGQLSDTVSKLHNLRMTPLDYFDSEEVGKFNNYMSDYLTSRGYQLQIDQQGNKVAIDEDGTEHPLDSSFIDDMVASKGEIITGIGGAIAGSKYGARKGPWGVVLGGIFGGASGTAAGKQLDMIKDVLDLDLTMRGQKWAEQASSAAAIGVAGDIIGAGVIRYGAKGLGKLKRAYDLTIGGNKDGAAKALMDDFGLSQKETEELVSQWENLTGQEAGGTFAEKTIRVVPSTRPGGEGLASSASSIDPTASNAIRQEIDTRAQDLLRTTEAMDEGKLLNNVRNDLDEYEGNIKEFYGGVRTVGENIVKQTHGDITFDAGELGLEKLFQNVADTTGSDKVAAAASKHYADVVGNPNLSFKDLIDLRQEMNYFKSNSRDITSTRIDLP